MPRLLQGTILLFVCSTMLARAFGAVPTSSAWPVRDNVITVRAFGVRGDGRSDDTVAILAAINAACAVSSPVRITP